MQSRRGNQKLMRGRLFFLFGFLEECWTKKKVYKTLSWAELVRIERGSSSTRDPPRCWSCRHWLSWPRKCARSSLSLSLFLVPFMTNGPDPCWAHRFVGHGLPFFLLLLLRLLSPLGTIVIYTIDEAFFFFFSPLYSLFFFSRTLFFSSPCFTLFLQLYGRFPLVSPDG